MKSNWLVFFLLSFAVGLEAFGSESKSNGAEFIYRGGRIESAASCPAPESQTKKPKFKALVGQPDLLNNLTDHTIQIGASGPQEVVGAYFQLDFDRLPQLNNRNVYVYYNCGGEKYFSFKVFKAGSLSPIALVGVSEKDASIFNGGRRLSDKMTLAEIDPEHYSASTSELLQNRLDPARQNVSPVAAQTQAIVGKSVPLEISDADIQAAEQDVKLPTSGNEVIFKPVKQVAQTSRPTSTSAPVKTTVTSSAPRGATATAPKVVQQPPAQTSTPAPMLGNIENYHQIAPWSQVPGSMLWTRQAVETIRVRLASLDQGLDVNDFCPGYRKPTTTESQHIACWIRIAGGVMQKESGFKPGDSLIENSGEASVGLMAMSPGQCPNARSVSALKDPLKNIECAINVMANAIQRDHYISAIVTDRKGRTRWAGASSNWSCLQTPHKVFVRSIHKTVRVGFKQDIIRVASSYDRIL